MAFQYSFEMVYLGQNDGVLLIRMTEMKKSEGEVKQVCRDVVVYGGTSAGVVAGVKAARMGRSVVVIEPTRFLGGLTTGGLGATDSGDESVIGGISREFYRRVKKHYDNDASWNWQKKEEYKPYDPEGDALFRFEPKVATKIFNDMISEAGVDVVFGERLNRGADGIRMNDGRIEEIVMESGRIFKGGVFIDATYEGDLMALAGVEYHVGREPNSKYGETLNGVQTGQAIYHQFMRDVDPYIMPGDPSSGMLQGVHADGPGEEFSGDDRIQAYNYRMCLTNHPGNRASYVKPEGYDPMHYELLARYLEAMPEWDDIYALHTAMPNCKTDTNNRGGFGTDFIGMNYGYPEGSYAERESIIREHETYQKGLMWFLAYENEPRVPPTLREKVLLWGPAKDEFLDSENWPRQLYIREARRMVSDYVHTEHDCRSQRETPESVGMGSYTMDSHHTQRYVDAGGHVRNEGDVQVKTGGPYRISYRSIRPKAEECSNLLVPVCVSSSHIAFGSVRMEPVFMILGQSAATAACIALENGVAVQDVDYTELRVRLLEDGQILEKRRAD